MAVTNGFGQGVINNTIEWGKGSTNATNGWGEIYEDSPSGDTVLNAETFSNVYSTEFDGVDDYVETNSIYSELDGQNKMTLSLWMKPISGAPLYEYVVTVPRNSTANEHVISFQHYENNYLSFSIDGRTAKSVQANISSITYGSWNHILCCLDGTLSGSDRMRIYVNGVDEVYQTSIGTFTALQNSSGALIIGEEPQNAFNPYKGFLDEVAIWSGTDLRSDVATIYNGGTPNDLNNNGLTAPISWWRFEEGSGTTAVDSGTGGNDGTLINGVTYSTDKP